jgi:pimeloyl-ACP methyl ester carboxylesterase
MERYVADVLAVLDALAVDEAAFWGYSSGALVGYALAAGHPDRIGALIASGAIGGVDCDDPNERLATAQRATYIRQHGVASALEEEPGTTFPAWLWQQMGETDAEMFGLQLLGASEWRGPWSVLPAIKAGVLMLLGDLEDPQKCNRRAAAVLPKARCVSFPALDHVGAYLRSDLALAEAVPFLEAARKSWHSIARP